MRPRFSEFGITRLARLTGLDHIGIPVWAAIRPNSRTLSGSQGKGLDDEAAQASAVMEAVEVATAERTDLPHRLASLNDLRREGLAVDPLESLLRLGEEPLDPDATTQWAEGWDILNQRQVFVPLEACTFSDSSAPPRYWQSTDGLASGNTLWEAMFHGLCERIERDALTLWALRDDAYVASKCVAIEALEDAELSRLADMILDAGRQLRLFDITSDVNVPVYLATISPPPDGQESRWTHFELSSGSGCHPISARAAIRAVTEAAQTRVTTIAATRDDFDPEVYRRRLSADLLVYVRAVPLAAKTGRCAIGHRRVAHERRPRLRRRQSCRARS
jgi:YcaO-like protein with predicted kinase domain